MKLRRPLRRDGERQLLGSVAVTWTMTAMMMIPLVFLRLLQDPEEFDSRRALFEGRDDHHI
jgi:hypothetical protein